MLYQHSFYDVNLFPNYKLSRCLASSVVAHKNQPIEGCLLNKTLSKMNFATAKTITKGEGSGEIGENAFAYMETN